MTKTVSLLFVALLLLSACGGNSTPVPAAAPNLGRVWHEKEGPWEGTWTRRGDTSSFDAVWRNPEGVEISDLVTFESMSGQEVTLYRQGTRGRYHGTLSSDGTAITDGRADWFSAADSWSATIEK